MSGLSQMLLASSFTVICGVIVFSAQQIVSKFMIEPIHEQRKTVGEIADALIFFSNIYGNPGLFEKVKMDEASFRLRQLATLLQSKSHLIPCYELLSSVKCVPARNVIKEASSELIGLSNSIHDRPKDINDPIVYHNIARRDHIKNLLNLMI